MAFIMTTCLNILLYVLLKEPYSPRPEEKIFLSYKHKNEESEANLHAHKRIF